MSNETSDEEPYSADEVLTKLSSDLEGLFDFGELAKVDPEEFIGFGLKDTHIYRTLFIRLLKDSGLNKAEKVMVVFLATVLAPQGEGVLRLPDLPVHVQETAATFAVVHIPSCMPPVAGLSWVYATVERNRTVDNFLANTWAGQFALNKSAQDKHKRWEVDFWDNNVERGGDNYERGFNEDYYGNTVEDQYPLMNKDGSYYKVPTGGYSEVDLGKWLSTFDTGRDTGASSSRS
ncbi:Hypothetical protein FKW44_016100 [Caligus rogercresseyi]|uniref:Uncharacterized protein n=1 Tax=Caligus rogercresseyi TaxID=217165 RepID=A0A7T8H193_CALRO|nr:Hypothetical protein FKW44_016100 [Caligus rogercresseyi]